ncbi:protein O-mannosyl-transferase family [Winogradskyella litorisediminis]|uniref:Protein O-mannosyl-transferase family n=1 Tax=Winogradskyella litorisediminis TaxID=1156618 RepID=A0ABW3N748_9FLAO
MTNFNFKKWNTIIGWFVFAIAAVTYALTIEPTVSYWDAGEYILTSSKLQVGHPPGAPLFQMLGAFFSWFALEPSQIGALLNMMSAVSSAFTILFMFWTVTILLRKMVKYDAKKDTTSKGLAILGSALVGSLAFTFTDSFWFNAVETEVYAMATLIMAIMFYLALRWEAEMHTPRGNRWLILIAFVIGLSFGVHFMGLLTIPAIGLIYFFKNYKTVTVQNFILANVISAAILLFIFKLLLPNALRFFGWMEVNIVNGLGLPFHSGTIIAGIMIIAAFYFGLKYTRNKGYIHANTLTLCLLFIFIGFSSWMMLPIRANAHVIINENDPSDARELLAYYNLEQYPETHLFYGPQFTELYSGQDEDEPFVDDKKNYERNEETGKYEIINDWEKAKQNYNSEHAAIMPRMWSTEHAENYMMFTGLIDFKVKPSLGSDIQRSYMSAGYPEDIASEQASRQLQQINKMVSDFKMAVAQGRVDYEDYHNFLKENAQSWFDVEKPSFLDNVVYMFQYQFGYMYWRYFMWNFTGRQNDIQGKYDDFNGNWISGIGFIDDIHIGLNQDNLPSDVENNKGRNTYYFLPLILGLIGFFFLLNVDRKRFWVMLVFFLLTGLAIQFYTNVRPFEPRERDYSVVGSFYVFAIWIGFGVYALYDLLSKKAKKGIVPIAAIILACLIAVPGVLAANNWDDHDRSGKYTANAMARKYLESCAPNAILFTIGDNDSFPLWYLQEIEGVRTDVRVVNTSLFQTAWYIDQMKRKAYSSDPIPSQLEHKQYRDGTRDYTFYREISDKIAKDTLNIKDFMSFIGSDDPKSKLRHLIKSQGEDPRDYPSYFLNSNYYPTRNIKIPVNKEAVLKNGIVKPKDADKIEDNLYIKISGSAVYKNRLLMLDIIANNNWERPIYFSGGAFADEDYIWMKDYLQLDGLCYKLVPIKTKVDKANPFDMGRVDPDLMYDMVTSWDWGGSGEDIYYDVETRKNGITYRGNIARGIEALLEQKDYKRAEELADIAMEKMPVDDFGFYTLLEPYISTYFEVGKPEKAKKLYLEVAAKYQENLVFYSSQDIDTQEEIIDEIFTDIQKYRSLVDALVAYGDKDFALQETRRFNEYLSLFGPLMGDDDLTEEPEADINELFRDGQSANDTINKVVPADDDTIN